MLQLTGVATEEDLVEQRQFWGPGTLSGCAPV